MNSIHSLSHSFCESEISLARSSASQALKRQWSSYWPGLGSHSKVWLGKIGFQDHLCSYWQDSVLYRLSDWSSQFPDGFGGDCPQIAIWVSPLCFIQVSNRVCQVDKSIFENLIITRLHKCPCTGRVFVFVLLFSFCFVFYFLELIWKQLIQNFETLF